MTIPPLLTPTFWFSTNPPAFSPLADRLLLILPVALLIVGIIGLVYIIRASLDKMLRRVLMHVGWVLVWAGVLGLLLYAFAYERIPVLSTRVLWLVWAGWLAWEAYRTWRQIKVELPKDAERRKERERLEKWLPKRRS